MKILIQKDICNSRVTAALLVLIAKIRKQPKCPTMDEWIKKRDAHIMEYYWAMKEEILPFVTASTELEGIV